MAKLPLGYFMLLLAIWLYSQIANRKIGKKISSFDTKMFRVFGTLTNKFRRAYRVAFDFG
jgi:uncharacterized protein (DUF2236 family)